MLKILLCLLISMQACRGEAMPDPQPEDTTPIPHNALDSGSRVFMKQAFTNNRAKSTYGNRVLRQRKTCIPDKSWVLLKNKCFDGADRWSVKTANEEECRSACSSDSWCWLYTWIKKPGDLYKMCFLKNRYGWTEKAERNCNSGRWIEMKVWRYSLDPVIWTGGTYSRSRFRIAT